MLQRLLDKNNMTKYRLAKICDIPYSTLNDICNNKTPLNKCSAEIVYKISKALNVTMESLVEPFLR